MDRAAVTPANAAKTILRDFIFFTVCLSGSEASVKGCKGEQLLAGCKGGSDLTQDANGLIIYWMVETRRTCRTRV